MTNAELAAHFAALPPNEDAKLAVHHPDAACLQTAYVDVLEPEDLEGFSSDRERVGDVAVRLG